MTALKAVLEELSAVPCKGDGGVYITKLNPLIKKYKYHTDIALELWSTGSNNARELAARIANPADFTEKMLENWLKDLDEWGICDSFTGDIAKNTPFAIKKAHEWAERSPEFEKRAAFALIAQLAWTQNGLEDDIFTDFLPLVDKHATDDRYYVKKAVNWALRDIGKRNASLRPHAVTLAEKLQRSDDKTARWVGRHRIKEIL